MKSISLALEAHLAQSVTTLATCWKITRTDGIVLGYTDHDIDITFDNILHKAATGFFRSAIENSADGSVDNMEVGGFLDDASISETSMRNGAFDYAEVEIFVVNWNDLSQGSMSLRYGRFGEVVMTSSGRFTVELRGLTQLFAQTVGEVYSPECRADLGDHRCKVQISPPVRSSSSAYSLGTRVLVPSYIGDKYNLTVPNGGFENGDLSDWGVVGAYVQSDNFHMSPATGTYFAQIEKNGPVEGYIENSVDISSYNTAKIDNMEYTLKLKGQWGGNSSGCRASLRLIFRDGANGAIPNTTIVYPDELLTQEGVWEKLEKILTVPALTRRIDIRITCKTISQVDRTLLAVDSVGMEMYEAGYDNPESYATFGSVEFEVTTAGTTALVAPTFDYTLGNTTVDGTVTWTAVAPTYSHSGAVDVVTSNSVFTVTGIDKDDDFFKFGVLEMLGGDNHNKKIEVKSWNNTTKQIELMLPMPYVPQNGDTFRVVAGCNKSRSICATRFNNILNYRGEPDIPGTGQYFKIGGANV